MHLSLSSFSCVMYCQDVGWSVQTWLMRESVHTMSFLSYTHNASYVVLHASPRQTSQHQDNMHRTLPTPSRTPRKPFLCLMDIHRCTAPPVPCLLLPIYDPSAHHPSVTLHPCLLLFLRGSSASSSKQSPGIQCRACASRAR